MERGELFGEMGLLDGEGRSAEARALEPSRVIEVPYEPVRAAFEARPELLWGVVALLAGRSEEHTSELQSLMRISYAVFCLKKKTHNSNNIHTRHVRHR